MRVWLGSQTFYYEADVELTKGEYYYKYSGEDGLELIDKKNKDIFIDESGCWSVLTVDEDGVVEKEIESSAKLIEYGISHKMMEVVPDKAASKAVETKKVTTGRVDNRSQVKDVIVTKPANKIIN